MSNIIYEDSVDDNLSKECSNTYAYDNAKSMGTNKFKMKGTITPVKLWDRVPDCCWGTTRA